MVRVAICDDMPLQREINRDLLLQYAQVRKADVKISEFSCGNELLMGVKQEGFFDVYLMDQNMPLMSGLEVCEKLRRQGDNGIYLFVSDNAQAVFDAFKVKAFGYLLKPVSMQQFFDLFDRVKEELVKASPTYFVLKTADGDVKLQVSDISYIEKDDRSMLVHMDGGATYTSQALRKSMKEALAELLADRHFEMAGASVVINLSKINSIETDQVNLKDGSAVPIPRRSSKPLYDAWIGF